MRVIGLDYGTKTVGVALSDALGITAQPVETITRKEENKLRKTYARIEEIISQNDVDRIVVGLPKNMNNTVGERVVMWDERLTTVSAEKALMESGVRRENRKAVIDQIAAVFILQGYLDSQSNK